MTSENKLYQHRALLTLNQIVKELASKKLLSDRKLFQEISNKLLDYLAQLSHSYFSLLLQATNREVHLLEVTILITKILHKLLVHGKREYTAESTQIRYLHFCLQQIPSLLEIKKQNKNNSQYTEKIKKLIIIYLKILLEVQKLNVLSFNPVLGETIKFCLETVLTSSSCTDFSMMVIYCSNILCAISRSYKKTKKSSLELSEAEKTLDVACLIKEKILTEDCVQNLCRHLILHYFPLTDSQLDEWRNDPEDYMLIECGESHKFVLKACIESLFVGLFYDFKSYVIPVIMNFVAEVNNLNVDFMSENDLLKVAAVYRAVGVASYELFHDLDFDVWFENKLLYILNMTSPNMHILQQHIIWLIGEWINVKFSASNRITLYQVISSILTKNSTDVVIKLTSCKTLRSAIDDFEFIIEDFSPFVHEVFVALCELLVNVQLCDTKMMILNVLAIMIERMGKKIVSSGDLLVQYLPHLWELSEAHNLLRGAVINLLIHLVKVCLYFLL